ncbi:MAG: hypothetical protein C5B55_06775 [Blastocatellia bacterium]|nr:MAG: hypothetical protein C5B55_06775 [Blastocatellia bacterium]
MIIKPQNKTAQLAVADVKDSSPAVTAAEPSELFFAWWPSSRIGPVLHHQVREHLRRTHRILTAKGFLVSTDPENVLGDGKTWVLECRATAKLPKDPNPAYLARQCLESAGVKVDAVVHLEEESKSTLHVSLSPPPQPITSVKVPKEPQTERRTKLLQKIYGVDVAELSAVSTITEEWKSAHGGEKPPMEYVIPETMKRVREVLGVRDESAKSEIVKRFQSTQAQRVAASAKPMLQFLRRGNEIVTESCVDMQDAVANACHELIPLMRDVRSIVRAKAKPSITVSELQLEFKGTILADATNTADWELFIEEFREKRAAGIRNVVIGLLARRTGLRVATVDTYTKLSNKRGSQ